MKINKASTVAIKDHHLVRSLTFALILAGIIGVAQTQRGALHSAADVTPPHVQATLDDSALPLPANALRQKVTVNVSDPNHSSVGTTSWTVNVQEHPEFIASSDEWLSHGYSINPDTLARQIESGSFVNQNVPKKIAITETHQDKKVTHAITTGVAKSGFTYDADLLALQITDAFERGVENLDVQAPFSPATVSVPTSVSSVQTLQLLATGRSNFSNSPEDRLWNIHKAIDEHIHNVYVGSGEIFSFNNAIDPPITLKKGWKEGLGLFGGGAAFTPGAGVCQVATTVYRAALLAGLPIVEKQNHSMWVDHYESYGVGLDATIFPGTHDLRFKNNTGGPLLIQSYTEGEDAIVNIFGIPDERHVSLVGPYFFNSPDRPASVHSLATNQIAWIRTIDAPGGSTSQTLISTYYKGYPRILRERYANLPGLSVLQKKNVVAADTE